MTVTLWRIGATTSRYAADDMPGAGAKNTGGRWNPVGMAVTYSSENIALAVHETVVHLHSGGLPLNRYLVRIEVPDDYGPRAKYSRRLRLGGRAAGEDGYRAGGRGMAAGQDLGAAGDAFCQRAGEIERAH